MKESNIIGMDLGDKKHVVCVLNAAGEVVTQTTVPATPEAVTKFFQRYRGAVVAMETGTHSRWVSRLATAAGLEALVGNARKLRAIWANERKSDYRDAEMLARIARLDRQLLYPIHHRDEATQARLVLIQARDGLVGARSALINQVRGLVKGFGARLRACSAECFHKQKLPEAVAAALAPVMTAIEQLTAQIRHYDREVTAQAAAQPAVQRLTQVPGVGDLTALAFVLTLDEVGRFEKSRSVGAFLGLVPRRDQSGQTDKQLRITKTGDRYLRRLLVGSAHYILGPFGPPCDLRAYGARIAARGGKNAKKRAVVAVARKLAVLLHALWKNGADYQPQRVLPSAA